MYDMYVLYIYIINMIYLYIYIYISACMDVCILVGPNAYYINMCMFRCMYIVYMYVSKYV